MQPLIITTAERDKLALVPVKQVAMYLHAEAILQSDNYRIDRNSILCGIWHLSIKQDKYQLYQHESGLWYCDRQQVIDAYHADLQRRKEDQAYDLSRCVVDVKDPEAYPPVTFGTDWYIDTDHSIVQVQRDYWIEATRLKDTDWIEHMAEKAWCDLNEFIPVFIEARRRQRAANAHRKPRKRT